MQLSFNLYFKFCKTLIEKQQQQKNQELSHSSLRLSCSFPVLLVLLKKEKEYKTMIRSKRTFLRAGDWLCMKCNTLSPSACRTCEGCNSLKQATSPLLAKWKCHRCKSENHSHRPNCWGCGFLQSESNKMSSSSSSMNRGNAIDPFSVILNAKWKCRCGEMNSKASNSCRGCRAHKSLGMIRN